MDFFYISTILCKDIFLEIYKKFSHRWILEWCRHNNNFKLCQTLLNQSNMILNWKSCIVVLALQMMASCHSEVLFVLLVIMSKDHYTIHNLIWILHWPRDALKTNWVPGVGKFFISQGKISGKTKLVAYYQYSWLFLVR